MALSAWFFDDVAYDSGSSVFGDSSEDESDVQIAVLCAHSAHSTQGTLADARGRRRAHSVATSGESATHEEDDPNLVVKTKSSVRFPLIHVPRRYLGLGGADEAPASNTVNLRTRLLGRVAGAKRSSGRPAAPPDDDAASRPSIGDDENASSSSTGVFVSRFDTVAAFQAAFHTRLTRPLTGAIVVQDVLLSVLLWLPVDQSTLLTVSRVCWAWREAAEHLPQWSLVPQLLHPNEDLRRFACSTRAQEDEFYGTNAETRADFIATMKARCRARDDARAATRRFLPSAICLKLRLHAFIEFLVVLAVMESFFLVNFAIGSRGVTASVLDSDVKIGLLCGFLSVLVWPWAMPISMKCWRNAVTPANTHLRNLRRRGDWLFWMSSATAMIMLGTVFGLLGARVAQAQALSRHVVSYRASGCPVNLTTDVPRYVEVESPGNWSIVPWFNVTEWIAEQPSARCRPNATRHWWADAYVAGGSPSWRDVAGEVCWQQFAANDTASRYVLLVPPTDWDATCSGVQIALKYEPWSVDFNRTVHGIFTGALASPQEYFRTPTSTPFLGMPDTAMGDAWFSSTNTSNIAVSPWTVARIPLVAAPPSPTPDQLVEHWWSDAVLWAMVAATYVFLAFLVVAIPKRWCSRSDWIGVYCLVICACMNPFWFVGFGAKCMWAPDPDVCLMSRTSAEGLFVAGVVMIACIGYAAAKEWLK